MNMKKFWKYFLITILLLIGLLCVGIIYLFFVPNSSLFGIMYISLNENYYSPAYTVANDSTIFINSRSYPVRFVESANEYMSVRVYSNSLGFVHESHSEVVISSDISSAGIKIDISEPYGASIINDSFIEIRLPENSTLNLNLTNKNASTLLNVDNLTINDLSYTTTSGDINLLSGTINGMMDLDLNKADFVLGSEVNTKDNLITLSLSSGKFDTTQNSIGELIVESNDHGVILLGECDSLSSRSTIAGGRIEATTLHSIELKSSDTNVYINNLMGGTIEMSKSGKISINNAFGNPLLKTSSGSIYIKQLNSDANLTTGNGNIKVDMASSNVTAKSDYGDIFINYISGDRDSAINLLMAETNNGKIEAHNVDRTNISISNRGRAYIYYNSVNGESLIDGENGEVYVQFNSDNTLTLTTSSNSGNVNVYYAGIQTSEPFTDKALTSFNINTNNTSNNKISVSTNSGNLRVRDNTMAELGY